jgi:hypothetical protein
LKYTQKILVANVLISWLQSDLEIFFCSLGRLLTMNCQKKNKRNYLATEHSFSHSYLSIMW